MDIDVATFALTLPVETLARLRAYAAASNSPIGNAAHRAITEGLDVIYARHPNLLAQTQEPHK